MTTVTVNVAGDSKRHAEQRGLLETAVAVLRAIPTGRRRARQ